ncbi:MULTISPECIES: hypothetical protein [unclassified Rickettsia]
MPRSLTVARNDEYEYIFLDSSPKAGMTYYCFYRAMQRPYPTISWIII